LKLSQKLGKLFRAETYARGWRRLQRKRQRIPLQPVLDRIDRVRLAEIQQRYAGSHRQIKKYAEVEHWLRINVERAQDLGLQKKGVEPSGSGLDVLDLGCGGGFFLAVCQQLGHRELGLDIDEFPLYAELVELLGVERQICEIKAFAPLPDLGRRFDLITAFSIGFNRKADKSLWGPAEWEFFLNDLEQRQLKRGGRIFLALNPQLDGDFYTVELRGWFVRRGARVERERVLFETGQAT
jgi:SAM-dependent methyltransferase